MCPMCGAVEVWPMWPRCVVTEVCRDRGVADMTKECPD